MSAAPDIKRLSTALTERGGLKLWSVLVTILGDMSQGGYGEVSGPVLSTIIEEMGLQPQAMRVALHRLKRDGWIKARHSSRIGYYSLSKKGLAETQAVAAKVYGVPEALRVCLAILPPKAEPPQGALVLARRTILVDAQDLPEDAVVCRVDEALPDWAGDVVAEAACTAQFADLRHLLEQVGREPATDLERLTLRVLVLHGWRRLILKSDPVAEAMLGPGAEVGACRDVCLALLERLPLPDPQLLLEDVSA